MRPTLARVARVARRVQTLQSAAAPAVSAGAAERWVASMAMVPAMPNTTSERAQPASPTARSSSLHQTFAAHSSTQLGYEGGAVAAAVLADQDEVVLRLQQHLASAFSEASLARGSGMPSARGAAKCVEARLTKAAQVRLEPGTPFSLEGALLPSEQARLVVEAEYPFRVYAANPAWEAVAGRKAAAVQGQPCLGIVQGDAANSTRMQGLVEALRDGVRGTTTLNYVTAEGELLPVRITATPLVAGHCASSHMLLVFTPVNGVPHP